MAKKDKDKDKRRAAKQRQWEAEKEQINNLRAKAPEIKTALRAKGCNLPFYEFLDSYEDEFNAIASASAARFPSLVGAFEVEDAEYSSKDFTSRGVLPHWEHVIFNVEDPSAVTYNDRDPDSNINGHTTAYLDPDGKLRTIVLVRRQVKCQFEHREHKYHFKLIALCHELGHVDDLEKGINFDAPNRKANIIEAEVYAHLFALAEANRRALFSVADTLETSLGNYREAADYRGEVSRRVLDRYRRPERKTWQEYDLG